MIDLSEIATWKRSFGLLPIYLNPIIRKKKFLMLNGGYGDFCLNISEEEENVSTYFSESWSTNTKNFVAVKDDNVKIYNWISQNSETVPIENIKSNFPKFYNYLLTKSYKTENDAIPFILDSFRSLRNLTQEIINPTEALNLLFVLLISIEEDYRNIDLQKWNISPFNIPDQFDFFIERIREGFQLIKPKLDLILRHSSGALFQEAHKEVLYFKPQRDLFGSISSNLVIKKNLYTSVHYTPQYLARTIVENSLNSLDLDKAILKIFDPSCGSSEFIIETLKQLKDRGYAGSISVIGWDTSENAINTSNFLLHYENRSQWENKLNINIRQVEDSLSEHWDNDYDLILMNPPFISWELLTDKKKKESMVAVLGANLSNGKPNQSSAFFYKAAQSLGNAGVLGCVLPTSIFTFDTYSSLRTDIDSIITIQILAKLGNFVFEDALTDVCFFIGKKPKSIFVPKLLWSKNEKGVVQDALRDLRKMQYNNQFTTDEKKHSIYQPPFFPVLSESWKVISFNENKFLEKIERFVADEQLVRLSNIFTVQQGIRQGKKDIFKINDFEYGQLKEKEKYLFRPVVDNESLKNGKLLKNKYIWYPYNKDGMIFKKEEDIEAIYFFIKKIKPLEAPLKTRAGISEWWGLTRPRNWQFEKYPKLVSTEFGKSDSFAFDKEGDFVVERGNAWIPKRHFVKNDFYFYLSLFSSNIFDNLLSIYSKQLAGGNWYDLGAKYTKNIPIPNVHSEKVMQSVSYLKLVELGKQLEQGNPFVKPAVDEILSNYFYPKN